MCGINIKAKVSINDCAELYCYDSSCPIASSVQHKKTVSLIKNCSSSSYPKLNKSISQAIRLKKQENESSSFLSNLTSILHQNSAKSLNRSTSTFALKKSNSFANTVYELKPDANKNYSQLIQAKIVDQNRRRREERKQQNTSLYSFKYLEKEEIELVKSIEARANELKSIMNNSYMKRSHNFLEMKIMKRMCSSNKPFSNNHSNNIQRKPRTRVVHYISDCSIWCK